MFTARQTFLATPVATFAVLSLFLAPQLVCNSFAQVRTSDAPTQAAEAYQPETINVEFPGGKLADYVSILAKTGKVNVVVDQEVQDVILPSIVVTKVQAETAVRILTRLKPGMIKIEPDQNLMIIRFDDNYLRIIQPSVTVFSVAHILKDKKQEDLLSAVEIGLELQESEHQRDVTLKLHPETGLLFAKGTRDQLRIVDEIVDQLSSATKSNQQAQVEAMQKALREMQMNRVRDFRNGGGGGTRGGGSRSGGGVSSRGGGSRGGGDGGVRSLGGGGGDGPTSDEGGRGGVRSEGGNSGGGSRNRGGR